MEVIKKVFTLEDGRNVEIETGKLAKQADGSVVVKMGNTMLLATVCAKKEAGENVDFMPLTVDYQEKYASVGRFPGGFFKREARPSEYEIIIARLVDRALRPLFPEDFHAEVQVQITLISGDQNTPPDALAALAASAALAVSDIPFHGPVSEVRISYIDGKFVLWPSIEEIEKAELSLIVAATEENIMMVEGEMKETSEELMLEALKIAHDAIKLHCRTIKELEAAVNKTQKRVYCHEDNDLDLKGAIHKATYQKCYDFAKQGIACKTQRSEGFNAIKQEFIDTLTPEEAKEKAFLINRYYHDIEKEAMRDMVLAERTRLDGRKLDEIRPIWAEVDYLPTTHGSAIFTRGETQSLTTCTLGTKLDEQIIDGAIIDGKNNFLLHYNFPGFATGEVKGNRGVSRREIGHGNLAMRALKQIFPSKEECPYTIRIVSDILESNGSSSMATVCAGCLALMDAGVKITKPVSGIAMGLIAKDGKWAVLSDILGDEDHLGDMDFKVTGTRDGITACQMDIKCDGLSYEILAEALAQANKGRMHILDIIEQTMPAPREDYKSFVPRVVKLTIPKEFIGAIIGPGGKIIQEMQKETKTIIVIEERDEMGHIDIVSVNKEGIEAALAKIKAIITIPEVGEEYEGIVRNIQAFGAFVEFLPGKDGLLHVSEISWERVNNVEDALKSGDKIRVKLIEVDKKTGKYKLSHKALLPKPEGFVERPPRQMPERNGSDRGSSSDRNNSDRPRPQKPQRLSDDNSSVE
ncbi:MAG: polyribonucleotide nucleotidyltransferase [Bacteroidales bacterium]|nr:polyribonucleotide nucleotidyltransferase [Bacteroidales bacterium]